MTPRTLGLTDPLYQYFMQVGFREPQPLKLVREQTAPLPGAHMMIAPEQAQFMALLTRLLGVRRYLESLIDRFVEQLDQVFMLRVFHVDTIC